MFTFCAVQKQKAPQEAKGFGAILQEAADVVVDKWNAAGNLAPTYLHRLSELQIQDETYIHQQLVKPEEGVLTCAVRDVRYSACCMHCCISVQQVPSWLLGAAGFLVGAG